MSITQTDQEIVEKD
jgi:hypothetical protein